MDALKEKRKNDGNNSPAGGRSYLAPHANPRHTSHGGANPKESFTAPPVRKVRTPAAEAQARLLDVA
eukprot:9037675-Pyramimonas_sp.AAC.1